ncbi:MAG: hypothetical protein E7273_10585, partial [Pseudobutyrivibrio ruminis]|nr:hypothetical protein [Pseudobutyrivibrio ruminis]
MKNDANKKKIVIGSIVGAIILLLAIVGVVYSQNKKTNVETEVATNEQVNIDTVTSDVAEAAKGDTIEEASSTTSSTEEVAEVTVEASTETSSEEVVEAVAETSASNETTETVTVEAVANASTNTETVQTSTQSKGTVGWPNAEGGFIPNNTHGWPVISGYVGTGEGPGAAW